MHVTEQVAVPLGLADTWDFVWQVDRVAACLPGCEHVETLTSGQSYRARLADRIGPYRVEADLDVTVQDSEPQSRIQVFASGQDRRLGTSQRVTLELRLRELGPRETSLDIEAEVEVLGKIATLGQFAIKRKINDVMKQFGANIRAACAADPVRHA